MFLCSPKPFTLFEIWGFITRPQRRYAWLLCQRRWLNTIGHIFTNVFQMEHFSVIKFHIGYEKYMWCDQAKSVWSQSNSHFSFLTTCLHHFHSYILQKTPLNLASWFQRYEQLKDAKNNRKRKTFSSLFGPILRSIFMTSDWFCLITSHMNLLLIPKSPITKKPEQPPLRRRIASFRHFQ